MEVVLFLGEFTVEGRRQMVNKRRYFQMLGTVKKNKRGNVIESDWGRITFVRWSGKSSLER